VRGTFGAELQAVDSLTGLATSTATGKWQLKVSDQARLDVGRLESWSLIFKA